LAFRIGGAGASAARAEIDGSSKQSAEPTPASKASPDRQANPDPMESSATTPMASPCNAPIPGEHRNPKSRCKLSRDQRERPRRSGDRLLLAADDIDSRVADGLGRFRPPAHRR
jgi:hypothetical protein